MRFSEGAARTLYKLQFLIWTETLTWKMHAGSTMGVSQAKCEHGC